MKISTIIVTLVLVAWFGTLIYVAITGPPLPPNVFLRLPSTPKGS